jgi:hypothetical protein
MSLLTHAAPARTIPSPADVLDAIDAYNAAETAAAEARANLTRAQRADVEELPPGVEYLLCEAEYRWDALLKVVGIDIREPEPVHASVPVDSLDWGKSRSAA